MGLYDAQAQAEASKQVKALLTSYVVLRCGEIGDVWEVIGEAEGYSYRSAITKVTDDNGTYVAVPLRSWKPTTRSTKTTKQDVWT